MVGGAVGRPSDRDGLLMMDVDAAGLLRRAFDFEPAGGGVGLGRRGPCPGGREPAFSQAERIPT